MDAYELADDVKNISNTIEALEWVQKASPLLRQQADRIERKQELIREQTALLVKQNNRIAELEKKCKGYDDTYRLPTDQQSAEPFIWLKQDFDGEWIEVHPNKGIPLYTTPQIKELSDEEIMNLYKETKADNGGIREFVRAILKKANEK